MYVCMYYVCIMYVLCMYYVCCMYDGWMDGCKEGMRYGLPHIEVPLHRTRDNEASRQETRHNSLGGIHAHQPYSPHKLAHNTRSTQRLPSQLSSISGEE